MRRLGRFLKDQLGIGWEDAIAIPTILLIQRVFWHSNRIWEFWIPSWIIGGIIGVQLRLRRARRLGGDHEKSDRSGV